MLLKKAFSQIPPTHSHVCCTAQCLKQAEKVGEVFPPLFPAFPNAAELSSSCAAGRWAIANVSIHQPPCSWTQWSAPSLSLPLKARRMERRPSLPPPTRPRSLPLLIQVIHAKSPQHPATCRLFGWPGAGNSVFSKCDLLVFVNRR